MSWLFFAILAQISVSTAIFIDKFVLEKYIKDSLIVAISAGVINFFIGVAIFVFLDFPIFPLGQTVFIIMAGIFLLLYLIPYFQALEKDDASRIIPLFQSVPIFTLLISYFFLHEKLLLQQYFGFILIIISGFTLSLQRNAKDVLSIRPSFWLMMLSSALLAIAFVLIKFGLSDHNFWDVIAYQSMGVGLGTLIVALWPGNARRITKIIRGFPSRGWMVMFWAEIFNLGYQFLMTYAISLGPVALVSMSEGFQPAIVLGFGLIISLWFPKILKEEVSHKIIGIKLLAILLIFIGLRFIYL